jgi:hypothetical protein
MKDAILVAAVTVLFVTTSCAAPEDHTSAQQSASEPSSSGPSAAGAQPLTDPDCNYGAPPPYDTLPMYSGTHIGEADGSVDLGNGQSATIHFLEINPANIFPAFLWSSTTPIAIITFKYIANRPANEYFYFPPSISDRTYFIPHEGGPLTLLPADKVTAKFCYLASPTPPLDAGNETGTGGERPDSGGSDNGTDAGGGESGGGKTW